jgi:NADP-dependent aldehyde dehydrogenase
VLLSRKVALELSASLASLQRAGAELLVGGQAVEGPGYRYANTLLSVAANRFLERPHELQVEAFGNASLIVSGDDLQQLCAVIDQLEGNLTGSIYSASGGEDDDAYGQVAQRLRRRVGRLLNDKMPTGVAVTAAMHHGGPYPATGHPGFTSVGIPASLRRFAMLQCFDQVRPDRLPAVLRDKNPTGHTWRWIDGEWSQGDAARDVLSFC